MNAEEAFNAMLLDISNELNEQNLAELKFLCTKIGKKRMENVKVGIDLFRHLKELNELRPGHAVCLCTLLAQIKRQDLVDKVQEYMSNNATDVVGPPESKEQAKVKKAIDVIVENLGKDWLRYGRRLGLPEVKLEQIRVKHPFNLEEQVMGMFSEWKQLKKEDAKADDLVQALRSCRLNRTADLVETEMKD
ncbi:protein FADD [Sardina pilchardus]|uniref:protein FADD n=1 Tax=Sardina pilchardus TaxID=27697 RepID=UPI002E0E514A